MRPDLVEQSPRPQPGEPQRRIDAGGDHQVDAGRQVLRQLGDGPVDRLVLDLVVVVQHEHELVGERGERPQERGYERGERAADSGGRRGSSGTNGRRAATT